MDFLLEMNESPMDITNLIRSVKCREAIWNRQHPQYKDREYSMLLWSQVASEVGVDVETARYKWRGLRDTFRVQLRKLNQPHAKRAKTQLNQKWEYYDEMMFVKDQIYIDVNRKKYYSKSEKGESDDEKEFQGLADFCVAEVREDGESLEFNEAMSHVSEEEKDLRSQKLTAHDDNYCFLMSILPQLRSLPNKEKLFVRIKIQEMLLNEVLNLNSHE